MSDVVAKEMLDHLPGAENVISPLHSPVLDKSGAAFDSSLHQEGKDGNPVITKKGVFKKKAKRAASAIGEITPPDDSACFQACGVTTAEMLFIACQGIGGPEWAPQDAERAYMTEAWTQYFQAKGVTDLPPGVIVATAMISYGAPRFTMPVTQGKATRAFLWLKSKVQRIRGVRKPADKAVTNGTPTISRHD